MLCLRTSWGAIVGRARHETRSDSCLRVLHGGFHAAGACKHCMLRQGTLLDANSERFNIWRSARVVAAAGRRRRQRGARARRRSGPERLPRPRPRGSQPAEVFSSSKARPIYVATIRATRSQAQPTVAKHSTAIPSTAIQLQHSDPKHSTAIRSTAQRSSTAIQHSEETHAREVMADQAQQGPGG